MEKKDLSVEELSEYEETLKLAEVESVKFLSQIKSKYDNQKLSSLYGYFLSNTKKLDFAIEVIKAINELKDKNNINDLIDFLMSKDFDSNCDTNDVVNAKIICIKALSNYKDRGSIPALLYCLNDKNANYKMRFQAAEALGKIGDKNAVESLINVVSDEEEKSVYVRESCAVALGMIGDMRAIEPLLFILESKKTFLSKFTFLKERVMEALAKINFTTTKRVMNVYKNALDDDSAQVRINAIECIMNSDDKNSFDLIKTKLNDDDPEVIKNAVIAMYNLKGVDALNEILSDPNVNNCAKIEADKLLEDEKEEE